MSEIPTEDFSKEKSQPERLQITVENLVGASEEQLETAITGAFFVLEKYLDQEQKKEPINIIFTDRIYSNGEPLDHYGEAFPDGKTIVLALESPKMKQWVEILGENGSMLFLTAHEARHIVQMRKGDPPPELRGTYR